MAMSTDKKLYVAVGLLAVLGMGYWAQRRSIEREEASYTVGAAQAKLPRLTLTEDQQKKLDRIVIEQPPGDAGKPPKVVLEKSEDSWKLVEPVKAAANQSNVESLLKNLGSLKITEQISNKADTYAQNKVSGEEAVHVTVSEKGKALLDLYFGEGGSRGQMMRIADQVGVFAVQGYSSYLVARELKGWRDLSIVKYDDKQVKAVTLENEYGTFQFTKEAAKADEKKDDKADQKKDDKKATWKLVFKKAKGGVTPVPRFDSAKVDDLVRAFKSLNGIDFGRDKKPQDVGLDKPSATVTFEFEDGARKVLNVGKAGEKSDRWIRAGESEDLFTITKYTSEWLTSDVTKFQKPEDKKGKDKAKDKPAAPEPPVDVDFGEPE